MIGFYYILAGDYWHSVFRKYTFEAIPGPVKLQIEHQNFIVLKTINMEPDLTDHCIPHAKKAMRQEHIDVLQTFKVEESAPNHLF